LPDGGLRVTERQVARVRRGVAARVRKLRGERSRREFADATGLSYGTVERLENAEIGLSMESALRLHSTEGVSIDWLLLGVGRRKLRW